MAYLVLVRHTESEWNRQGLWTGWTDVPLDKEGKEKARQLSTNLQNIPFNLAFTSPLERSKHTMEEILEGLGKLDLPVVESGALKERDYGEFTGKNKWGIEKKFGEEKFLQIRRGWDTPIPGGESLKDVYNRVVPFYNEQILPELKKGKNILIVSHGNNLRSLVKFLDNISDEDIKNLEINIGEIDIYQIDQNGKVISKEIKNSLKT